MFCFAICSYSWLTSCSALTLVFRLFQMSEIFLYTKLALAQLVASDFQSQECSVWIHTCSKICFWLLVSWDLQLAVLIAFLLTCIVKYCVHSCLYLCYCFKVITQTKPWLCLAPHQYLNLQNFGYFSYGIQGLCHPADLAYLNLFYCFCYYGFHCY